MSRTDDINTELERAEAARVSGNEGRARVCARRTAGIAAADFLSRRERRSSNQAPDNTSRGSGFEALQTLANITDLAPHLKQAAIHLTMRINKEFLLPLDIDLIDEALILIRGLK